MRLTCPRLRRATSLRTSPSSFQSLAAVLGTLVMFGGLMTGCRQRAEPQADIEVSEPGATTLPDPIIVDTPAAELTVGAGTSGQNQPKEAVVIEIPLSGDIASRDAELSGLAWYGDRLVALPQYPELWSETGVVGSAGQLGTGDSDSGETEPDDAENSGSDASDADATAGALFAIESGALNSFLDGVSEGAVQAARVPIDIPSVISSLPGYEGFEAIAFVGDRVYLTVEADTPERTRGYLIGGDVVIGDDGFGIVLDACDPVEVPLPASIDNMSLEGLVIDGDTIVTFYEANGASISAQPYASRFTLDLEPVETLSMPTIEYRLTDVTSMDTDGGFWAINYFFPGDAEVLAPEPDEISERYGDGPTHARFEQVERLVYLKSRKDGGAIELADRAPVSLELIDAETARNWEGIVGFGQRGGWLLSTDKYPTTILGFVGPFDDQ